MKFLKTTKKLTEYIVFPLAFFLSGILFLYLVFSPFINMALSGWEMFSYDSDATFGEEIHNDIFSEGRLEGYTDTVPSSLIKYPTSGTKYAEITITANDSVNVIPLYYGDTSAILRKGAGQYMGSHFPGESTTILASAHNNTYFNCLQYVKVGDEIKIETTYGTYLYEVYLTEIKSNKDPMYNMNAAEETLILYTCYPFTELGITPLRYFVLARLVSGPKVLLDE